MQDNYPNDFTQTGGHPNLYVNAANDPNLDDEESVDIRELIAVLLDHWKSILVCMIITLLLFMGYTLLLVTPKYTATATIYTVPTSNTTSVNMTDVQLGTQMTTDYKELIQSRSLLTRVSDSLHLDIPYDKLREMVSVKPANDSRVLAISVTSNSPVDSANIANGIAEEAIEYLPSISETSKPSIVDSALAPTSPSSPSLIRTALIGILVGLILPCAFYIIRFLMNDKVTTATQLEKQFGAIPLATVPEVSITKLKRR